MADQQLLPAARTLMGQAECDLLFSEANVSSRSRRWQDGKEVVSACCQFNLRDRAPYDLAVVM